MDCEKIPCVVMRGGTSKGIFIEKKYLPQDPKKRDEIILSIFGSPDTRQIDGLGGADPLTSKLAIISPSCRDDADIDYTFGQVEISKPIINYSINCGNISSGVGPFAINQGLIETKEPYTTVKIFNTNTKKMIIAEVPVHNGKAKTEGNCKIDGVPGTGAEIRLTFCDPSGAVTGLLLPTGRSSDSTVLDNGKKINFSLVDAGTLYAFIPAVEMGLSGAERPEEIEQKKDFMEDIEKVRRFLASHLVAIGVVDEVHGKALSTSLKVAVIGEPSGYLLDSNEYVKKEDADLVARIINPGKVHKAFAVTGAICIGAAAAIHETVVNRITRKGNTLNLIRIGHPQGIIEAETDIDIIGNNIVLRGTKVKRTARRIMEGFAYISTGILS